MKFSHETRETEKWPSSDPEEFGHVEEKRLARENRRKERRKQEALRFLMESGRTKNPEDGEKYLETISQVRRKLISLMEELVADEQAVSDRIGLYPQVVLGRGDRPTLADLRELREMGIDQEHPQLWYLERLLQPHYSHLSPEHIDGRGLQGIGVREGLCVPAQDGPRFLLYPDINGASRTVRGLRRHLTEEEVNFIKQDYAFALRDLAREAGALAERLAGSAGQGKFSFDWRSLSEKESPQPS